MQNVKKEKGKISKGVGPIVFELVLLLLFSTLNISAQCPAENKAFQSG